jgi:hypothetical protein
MSSSRTVAKEKKGKLKAKLSGKDDGSGDISLGNDIDFGIEPPPLEEVRI